MTNSYWHHADTRDRAHECDIAILGGGITGLATAYWLSRLAPEARVTVVEGRRLAAGATGRNAGFLICGTADSYVRMIEEYGRELTRFVWSATRESIALAREFLAGREPDVDLVTAGSLVAAGDEAEAAELRDSMPLLAEDGFELEYHDRDPLGRGFLAALFNPIDCGIHPVKLARTLASASSAEILEGYSVTGISDEGGRVAISTLGGRVSASSVVVALNAWAPGVLSDVEGLVRPVRGQVLLTEPLPARVLEPMVYANRGFEYFRQLPDGRMLMGGWRSRFAETEIGYGEETTDGVQAGLEGYMRGLFPETASVAVANRWSGTMGFSPDLLPIFGRSSRDERVVFGVGFSGHGMSLGFWSGRTLARAALGGGLPEEFSPARFARRAVGSQRNA